jgi:hypothetical protein
MVYAQDETSLPEVTTMEEVIAALGDNDSVQVLFKNLEPIFVKKNLYIDTYMPDGKTLMNIRYACPAKFDAIGTYRFVEDYNGYRFSVDSIVDVFDFQNLEYLTNYYEQTKSENALKAINITKPVTITAVDGANVFVQYQDLDRNYHGDLLVINGEHSLAIGDKVDAFAVKYNVASKLPLTDTTFAIIRNDFFAVEATSLGNITNGNSIRYSMINSIANLSNHNAKAIQLPVGGTITKENDKFIYTIGGNSVELKSTIVDLEQYVGQTITEAIKGVVDNCNTADHSNAFIVNEIKAIDTNYATIAEWIEAAQNGLTTGSLKNPVNVTLSVYQSYKSYVFIEDETAAICLNFGDFKENPIQTGHVISGIEGDLSIINSANNIIAPIITMAIADTAKIQIIDSIALNPIDVTIAELKADEKAIANGEISQYANKLVRLNGVKKAKKFYGRTYYLTQGTDTLSFNQSTFNKFWSQIDTLQMTIVGVVDYRTINSAQLYSIYPRSVEDIHLVAPEFTYEEDSYEQELEVSLSMLGTKGVDYTSVRFIINPTEDQNPIDAGKEYDKPFYIDETTTIQAIATYPNQKFSPIITVTYTIVDEITVAEPTFTPDATAEYNDTVIVSMACETPKTAILYELSDEEPTIESARFEGDPLLFTETTTISAMAVLLNSKGEVRINPYDEEPFASDIVTVTYVVKSTKPVDPSDPTDPSDPSDPSDPTDPSDPVDPDVATDNVELMAMVYSYAGNVYVHTEIGNTIEVYTIAGQTIYTGKATNNVTSIDAQNNDVIIVRVNGETTKVAIK